VCGKAFTPLADGMAVAIELLGELLIGGVVVGGGVENETTAKGQGLRCGCSADQGMQLLA
jgi:hypothetical protein